MISRTIGSDILGVDRPGRARAYLSPFDDTLANQAQRCHNAHVHDLRCCFKRDFPPFGPFVGTMDGDAVVAAERAHPRLGPAVAPPRRLAGAIEEPRDLPVGHEPSQFADEREGVFGDRPTMFAHSVLLQFERANGESTAARLDKLEEMIARSGLDAKDIAPFLAALLSIPDEGRYPPLEMTPAEQKERTIAALISLFEGLSKDAPVLALLEDAHWIDPTSLDVFSRLVDRLSSLRALLVITFRPDFAPPWVGRAHVASLALNRFARRQVVAMIDRITGGKALPAEVLEQIVARTDGVPLFVEELTKTVLESDLLREESEAYILRAALTPLAIPSTLQDSLMARLGRLAPVRETAQIAAAIGREFSYRLLESVSPIRGAALQNALGQLVAAELIHARGAPADATYVFKHALVQDTAYASLLRSRRQRIHADIAGGWRSGSPIKSRLPRRSSHITTLRQA